MTPAPDFTPDPNLRIWLNGQIVSADEARVSVFDHGPLYGDGVFEGLRSYNGRIFARHAHVRRLFDSANALKLQVPYTHEQVDRALHETLEANGLLGPDQDAYLRLVVTRGVGLLGLSPRRTCKPQMFIIATTLTVYAEELYAKGMPVIISSVTRNNDSALPPRVKSLNYLNNILAKIEALDAGVPEAIMLNTHGFVAEATGDNVFIARNGQLHTPPPSAGILVGITRNTVIRLARNAGIEVVEKDLLPADLHSADEVFLTGTGVQLIPVSRIDDRPVADGAVGSLTRQMMDAYETLVRRTPRAET